MATGCPVAPLHQEASTSRLKITSVKTLAESSNLTSIPSHYAFNTSTSNNQAVHSDHDDSIPVIDFSLLSSSNPNQRSKVVSDLARACQDWGFFMVINHAVPESQMKATVDAFMRFFDLTEEEKRGFQGKHGLDRHKMRDELQSFGRQSALLERFSEGEGASRVSLPYQTRRLEGSPKMNFLARYRGKVLLQSTSSDITCIN